MRIKAFACCLIIVLAAAALAACGSGNADTRTKRVISTSAAPTPIGPYSQGILFGETLYCSGQIGIDPATGKLIDGGISAEADRALKNLGAILQAAGMDYSDVVMATIFLTDINDFAAVNAVYANYFTVDPPGRQAIQVGALPAGALVEISLVAMKSSIL